MDNEGIIEKLQSAVAGEGGGGGIRLILLWHNHNPPTSLSPPLGGDGEEDFGSAS